MGRIATAEARTTGTSRWTHRRLRGAREAADEQHRRAGCSSTRQFLGRSQLEGTDPGRSTRRCNAGLPFTFVGSGLPQIAELTGDAKSFAERSSPFRCSGRSTGADARAALTDARRVEGVAFDDDAVDLAIEIAQGYPYFIQELGHEVWAVAAAGRVHRRGRTRS